MDGVAPLSSVLPGPNGVLYGLTSEGGRCITGRSSNWCARVSTTAKRCCIRSGATATASFPQDVPGLIADRSGNLYGTTAAGGESGGYGTVFKLAPSGSGFTESVLYAFQGYPSDGEHPYGGLIFDSKGNLLGPTFNGGSNGCANPRGDHTLSTVGCGAIFNIAP